MFMGLTVSLVGFAKASEERNRARKAEARAELQRLSSELNERKALNEAARSEQVSKFLESMLEGAGPAVALGRDTTLLREILDRTVERLEEELKDYPEVEARLRDTIGETYRNLRVLPKAERMHRQALKLRRKSFGPEHLEVAESLYHLSWALFDQATSTTNKSQEAKSLCSESLAMRRKLLGEEHIEVSRSMYGLAWMSKPGSDEAVELFRQLLAMRRKLLGKEHTDIAQALRGLGVGLQRQGRFQEAEQAHREALAMQRRLSGDDHPDVAKALFNLGFVLQKQGRMSEAEGSFRERLAINRKLFGNRHPTVAKSLFQFTDILIDEGKLDEAEKTARDALEIRRRLPSGEVGIEDTAIYVWRLATVLREAGKLFEAEAACREMLEIARKDQGSEHNHVAFALNLLSNVLNDQDRLVEAESVSREALRVARKAFADSPSDMAVFLFDLAMVCKCQGKFHEAETILKEALPLVENQNDPQSEFGYVHAIELLCSFRAKMGDLKGAIDYCSKALEIDPTNLVYLSACGLMQLHMGDQGSHRATMERLSRELQRGNDSSNSTAQWACVLGPESLPDYSPLLNGGWHSAAWHAAAWKTNCDEFIQPQALGGLLYRAGRYAEACGELFGAYDLMRNVEAIRTNSTPAYASFLLTMTHCRLGKTNEAKEWFNRALAQDFDARRRATNVAKGNFRWDIPLALDLLRREAQSMLNPPPEFRQAQTGSK